MTTTPIERLRALPFFDPQDYLALNPDVRAARIDAAGHALRHGLTEGRAIFRREALARAWGRANSDSVTSLPVAPEIREAAEAPCSPISIFVNTASDPPDVALAADLAETLRSLGVAATLKDESEAPDADHGLLIVVAPHAFFNVGLGKLWARSDVVSRSLIFNTAPLHQRSFVRALPWILRSLGVMDASPQAVRIFQAAGLHALLMRFTTPLRDRWLEPSDLGHPLVQVLPRAARRLEIDASRWEDRPIDVAFFGVLTERRSATLRRQASTLAARPCFLYAAQGGRDLLDESVERRSHHRLAGHVSAHAKVTLHLAEDEFPHFDWHTCVTRTMASGSVVVTDTCPLHPDHDIVDNMFQDDVRHLGELIRWLLDDEEGRRSASAARESAGRAVERADSGFSATLRSFLLTAAHSTLP